jgi:hypothetical protein
LPGAVTQEGDDEGVLRLDRLPTPAEAEAIRDVIGIRRRRHLTAEALARLEQMRAALKSPFMPRPCVISMRPPSASLTLLAAPPTLWVGP